MAMGLSSNTPNYIWRMESGRRSVTTEIWKRAGNYLVEIMKMGEERWPRKCLKEEARGVLNGNPTKWGREVQEAMVEVGEGGLWRAIANGDREGVKKIIERAKKTKIDQEIQQDWTKIDQSTYCEQYKNRKHSIEAEKYWENGNLTARVKETWARLRCGNVGKEGNKGYSDVRCRICGEEPENVGHICRCRKIKEKMGKAVVENLEKWIGERGGEEIDRRVEMALKGEPVPQLCAYVRGFERLARKMGQDRGEGRTRR